MQRKINKSFVRQYSRFYCGLACLASVIRFHGGNTTQEKLQASSGTTLNGTSLLGLCQAAVSTGFVAGGYESSTDALKNLDAPVILHTIAAGEGEHFMVCYGFRNGYFIIGDPAKGVVRLTQAELESLWKSKALLRLTPGPGFTTSDADRRKRRDWFLRLIKPDIPVLFTAAFMGIIISVLSLATAIFSQRLIDRFLPAGSMGSLAKGLVIFGLVLLSGTVLGFVRMAFLVRQGKEMNIRLITDFFGKLLYLPNPFFDSTHTGDLVARLNDAQRIQRAVVTLSSQLTIDLLIVIASVVYIFTLSVPTAMVIITAIPVFGTISWLYNNRVVDSQKAVMQAYAATEGRYLDTLQGIKAIKSFNSEPLFLSIVNRVFTVYMQSVHKMGLISAKINFWIATGSSIWLVFVISWAAREVFAGNLLPGQLVAIMTVSGTMAISVAGIALASIQFHEARIAFDRLYGFSSMSPEYLPGTGTAPGIPDMESDIQIMIRNLGFRFPGRQQLFRNLDLNAGKGRIIAISGEAGCGKSTLLDIFLRFREAEEGIIRVNGMDLTSIPVNVWRGYVALVPQHISLFNATILENIAMEEAPDPQKVVQFCMEYGFHKYITGIQQGYATIVQENGRNLSGGQRQLIALARALYKKPKLLLLDEATSAMDLSTESFVTGLLLNLKCKMAVVIVTHREQLASLADTRYVMADHTVSISAAPPFAERSNQTFRESLCGNYPVE